MKKILFSLLMVLLFLGAVWANGQDESKSKGSGVELNPPGTYPIVNEPQSFEFFTVYNSVETSGKREESAFNKWYEELTGIDVIWGEVVEVSVAEEKINLRLASGDLPDAFSTLSIGAQQTFSNGVNGAFIPLEDYVDERMPNLKREMGKYPEAAKQMFFPDGHMYAFPSFEGGCYHCSLSKKMWINVTWLEKLGLDMPETTEEFYETLVAFRDRDPNGNGKADEMALLGASTGWNANPVEFIMNSFIFTNTANYVEVDGGKVSFVADREEWKTGLAYMKKLFDEGLMPIETFVQKNDQLKATVENPEVDLVGAVPAGWWGVFSVNAGESGRYADFEALPPLTGPSGLKQSPWAPQSISYQMQVTSAADNPAMIAQWADWFYESNENQSLAYRFKKKGEHYRDLTEEELAKGWITRDGSQATQLILLTNTYGSTKFDDGLGRSALRWYPKDTLAMPPEWAEDRSKQEYWLMKWTKERYEPYAAKKNLPPNLVVDDMVQDELADITQAMRDYISQATSEFITGVKDLDADWDAYVSELEAIGIPRYVDIWQETLTNAGY